MLYASKDLQESAQETQGIHGGQGRSKKAPL